MSATSEMPTMSSMQYASSAASAIDWGVESNATLAALHSLQQFASPKNQIETTMPNTLRRIVQVFVADPNENVPLDQSVLFSGEQKLTDLTDSELFFEVPLVEKLTAHNAKRVTWPDKEASKRSAKEVLLEPARIRDLKMVVVTVAQF